MCAQCDASGESPESPEVCQQCEACERSEGRGAAQELICTCLVAAADSALSAAEVADLTEACQKVRFREKQRCSKLCECIR